MSFESSPKLPAHAPSTVEERAPIAIQVRHLGKAYALYTKPIHRLFELACAPLSRLLGRRLQWHQDFHALQEVGFEVPRGSALAIVGRNGSGKSTLLQILCGTLRPSQGEVRVQGRVAALLELGAGFNPEFTGRENVFLNAALHGLTREQTEARFDAIARFADLGEFIDRPVKTYSSGMYVRLGFAVIAHVDADVLIIDEALAVGDALFTQKCMRFIREFQKRGTLLFVSHDMTAVQSLCDTALWLAGGRVQAIGPARDVVNAYLDATLTERLPAPSQEASILAAVPLEHGTAHVPEGARFDRLAALGLDPRPTAPRGAAGAQETMVERTVAQRLPTGRVERVLVSLANQPFDPEASCPRLQGGERVRVSVQVLAHTPIARPIVGFLWRDRLGQDLFGENTLALTHGERHMLQTGQRIWAHFEFDLPLLPNGDYVLMASLADGDLHDHVQLHWQPDAYVVTVASSRVRWGLVGVQCQSVSLEPAHA